MELLAESYRYRHSELAGYAAESVRERRADLYSSAIDTHVSGSGPAAFGIKRTWNLDPRGNRSGSQGVRDVDDGNGGASTTIFDTSVTVSSDKMNLYTSYAGKAYEFDACEQMTRDRSTETYHRYDWRGQLWRSDIVNSDVSDPERYYTYDCQGRRKTEVQLYKASPAHVYQTFAFISFCACATGGCGGDIAGDFVAQTYTFDSAGAVDSHVEHMIGLGAHGTGSSSATHPAAVFGPGGRPAGDAIVAERVTKGAVEHAYWRYEDQLNSCVGQVDENGWRTMQNSYLAFGEVMQSRVLYDGAVSRLSAVEYDGLALTTIRLANNDLSTDLLNGALLFLARPGYNGNRHMEAVVVDSTANSIVVEDLTGDLFEALGPEGTPIAGFVIFAFNDSKQANAPTYQTHGTWTSAPSYASSQTTFTDAEADDNGGGFASWMIGSILVPDVNIGAPLIITGATATTLTVAGDARGVASSGSQYIVYAAPFTDPVRGTWQTDPHKGGTRYLWAGYRYQPPQMGFWVDPPGAAGLGVYGASTGTNRLGQYYCWNRTYDINTGRWTTPDPAATPWWNLQDYVHNNPLTRTDSNGLKPTHRDPEVVKEIEKHEQKKRDAKDDELVRKYPGTPKKIDPEAEERSKLRAERKGKAWKPNDEDKRVANNRSWLESVVSYGNYCGPGAKGGAPVSGTDNCCKKHDECFWKAGIDAASYGSGKLDKESAKAACKCNSELRFCLRDLELGASCGVPFNESFYGLLVSQFFQRTDAKYGYCDD